MESSLLKIDDSNMSFHLAEYLLINNESHQCAQFDTKYTRGNIGTIDDTLSG